MKVKMVCQGHLWMIWWCICLFVLFVFQVRWYVKARSGKDKRKLPQEPMLHLWVAQFFTQKYFCESRSFFHSEVLNWWRIWSFQWSPKVLWLEIAQPHILQGDNPLLMASVVLKPDVCAKHLHKTVSKLASQRYWSWGRRGGTLVSGVNRGGFPWEMRGSLRGKDPDMKTIWVVDLLSYLFHI